MNRLTKGIAVVGVVPATVLLIAGCSSGSGGSSASPTTTSSPTASPTGSSTSTAGVVTKKLSESSTAMIGTQSPLNVSKGTLTIKNIEDGQEITVTATGKSGSPDWALTLKVQNSQAFGGNLTYPDATWNVKSPSGSIRTTATDAATFTLTTAKPIDVTSADGTANTLSLDISGT